MVLLTMANIALSASPLVLSLRAGDQASHVGDNIELQLSITNVSKSTVEIDDGAVSRYLVFSDTTGAEIEQWPFMDILATEPGIEAYWTLAAGETQIVGLSFTFKRDRWSGFGVPDGEYRGLALEVWYGAGRAIHAVPRLPAVIRVEQRWLADPGTVRSRALRCRSKARNLWSGELASNPVHVKLTEAVDAKLPGPETYTGRTYPEILAQIAADIERLKPDYPQLREFEASDATGDRIFYDYKAAPDPKIKAGWRRGFPLPRRGGVVIWIRLLDGEAITQDVFMPATLGRMDAPAYVMDGKGTKPLAKVINEILKRHGWKSGTP